MLKLSIVVPVYHVEDYLPACLDSIYSQITPQCEVIIVDDGGSEGDAAICDSYGKKYAECTKVIHQQNMGLGGARNTGTAASQGEYLFFIDSDDTLQPGTIESILGTIEKYGCDMVVFPLRVVAEDSERSLISVERDASIPVNTPLCPAEHHELITGLPAAWNKVAKASLYKDYGIEYPSRVWYEDIRTTPKIISNAKSVVYLDTPFYNYLRRQGSIMNSSKVERNVEIIEALEDLWTWFEKAGKLEDYKAELEYLTIHHSFIEGAVRTIRQAGTKHPLVLQLVEYGKKRGGNMSENVYVKSMDKKRKLIFTLMKIKAYWAVSLIFKIKK